MMNYFRKNYTKTIHICILFFIVMLVVSCKNMEQSVLHAYEKSSSMMDGELTHTDNGPFECCLDCWLWVRDETPVVKAESNYCDPLGKCTVAAWGYKRIIFYQLNPHESRCWLMFFPDILPGGLKYAVVKNTGSGELHWTGMKSERDRLLQTNCNGLVVCEGLSFASTPISRKKDHSEHSCLSLQNRSIPGLFQHVNMLSETNFCENPPRISIVHHYHYHYHKSESSQNKNCCVIQ